MSNTYAKGTNAVGECQRSGRKMLLRTMVRDGYYPNLLVDPAWRETRHPQERLVSVFDPVTLYQPAPENNRIPATIDLPVFDLKTGKLTPEFKAWYTFNGVGVGVEIG